MKPFTALLMILFLTPAVSIGSDLEWEDCYSKLTEDPKFIIHERYILDSEDCLETIRNFVRGELGCTSDAVKLEFTEVKFLLKTKPFCMFTSNGGTYKYLEAERPGGYLYGMLAFEHWD